jgi:alpha-glucoside transport system permease protein
MEEVAKQIGTMSAFLSALSAIVLGCGGVIALFYGLNAVVNRLPERWRSPLLPWVYLTPALVVLAAYLVLPTLNTVWLSFLNNRSDQWVGLGNYRALFTNPTVFMALRNTLLWLVGVTSVSVGLGLLLAVLADRVKYENWIKSLVFMPMAMSFVGASIIWRFVYAFRPAGQPQIGLLNAIATHLGSDPIGWTVQTCLPLANWPPLTIPVIHWTIACWGIPSLNTFALMVIMIWLETGFCMVLLSAAVKNVPQDLLEAARIDGATEWQIFWRIILPMIRSTVIVVATTVVVFVLKVFDIVYVMTAGNQNTEVIATRMIKEMFTFRDFGRGSAIAVLLLLAVIPVVIANIRRDRQTEELSP